VVSDAIPFSTFLYIWIFIFCVMYRIIGALQSAADDYQGIVTVLGFFFFNFENGI
jgi:hypothetical protein